MYKKTSDSLQFRARRSVVESRANVAGVDPTAFKSVMDNLSDDELLAQRERLIIRKREAESRVAHVMDQLRIASGRARSTGKYLSTAQYGQLVSTKQAIGDEVRALDRELTAIKEHLRKRANIEDRERKLSFDYVFRQVAQEILAGPVYDRIVLAAVHRVEESAKDA